MESCFQLLIFEAIQFLNLPKANKKMAKSCKQTSPKFSTSDMSLFFHYDGTDMCYLRRLILLLVGLLDHTPCIHMRRMTLCFHLVPQLVGHPHRLLVTDPQYLPSCSLRSKLAHSHA
jgi:hypothetical protein